MRWAMPIWEYRCSEGHTQEHVEKMPQPFRDCPICGCVAPRVFSAPRLPADGKYSYREGKDAA